MIVNTVSSRSKSGWKKNVLDVLFNFKAEISSKAFQNVSIKRIYFEINTGSQHRSAVARCFLIYMLVGTVLFVFMTEINGQHSNLLISC